MRPLPTPRRPPRVSLLLDLNSHIHRGVIQGICRYVRMNGAWDFCSVQRQVGRTPPPWDELKPDGIVAYAPTPELTRALSEAGCAVVNLAEVGSNCVRLPSVIKDQAKVGRLGVDHFIERGLTYLAFAWHQSIHSGSMIAEGVRSAAAGRPVHMIELRFPLKPDWQWEDHRAEIVPWLQALPVRTGLMACNDYFARQLLDAAEALGRRVPEDIAILGVNDNPLECELSRVPLSSVVIAAERIGWEACCLLEKQWAGRLDDEAETVWVEPISVAVRASSDVFAISDQDLRKPLQWLHARAGRDVDVDDLVRLSGMSRRRFEVRFRAAVGRSPYEEILRLRIARARELLAHTDLKVEAIAHQSGFQAAKVFHHQFRKLTGYTPAAFRSAAGFSRSSGQSGFPLDEPAGPKSAAY